MNNNFLKDYVGLFADDSKVGFIVANPKDRKVYDVSEVLAIKDDDVDHPVFCIDVSAARDMDKDELEATMDDERAAQPELPKLKNNDQRKEFLRTYRDWLVWFEVPQAEEVYYRYILPDNSAIVICEYKRKNDWWTNKYIDHDSEFNTYTEEYLLEPGYKYLHNCRTNETALIRKLMEVQRK